MTDLTADLLVCPHCAAVADDRSLACPSCGALLLSTIAAGPRPTTAPRRDAPVGDAQPATGAAPSPEPAVDRPPLPGSGPLWPAKRTRAVVAATATLAAATVLLLWIWRPDATTAPGGHLGSSPAVMPPPHRPAAVATAPTAVTARTASAWTRAHAPGSVGARTVMFELKAQRDIPVWMRRVRPTLAVRCLGRDIEAFVVTGWPAAVEQRSDQHSVTIGFDGRSTVTETWEESADKHALFAPDGEAFTRRLTQARTLRFGFSPYNAAPVTVEFDVTGVDTIARVVASRCRRAI